MDEFYLVSYMVIDDKIFMIEYDSNVTLIFIKYTYAKKDFINRLYLFRFTLSILRNVQLHRTRVI